MKSSQLLAAIVTALASASPSAFAADLVAKQLAGPPAEFAAMQPVEPGAAAIHSKSALIPVRLQADKAGGASWQGRLPVENGRTRFLVMSGSDAGWNVELASPNGRSPINAQALDKAAKRAEFGIEMESFPADLYRLDQIESGQWNIKLSGARAGDGYLVIEGDARSQLASYHTGSPQLVGQTQQIAALLTRNESGKATRLGNEAGRVQSALLRVTAPDGQISEHAMFDDGKHGDGLFGDGIYGGEFKADQAGRYLAQVQVEAIGVQGQPLLRTAEHVVPVLEPVLSFAADRSQAKAAGNGRLSIPLPVASSKADGHYRAYAEVWGSDKAGRPTPIAWISGMVEAGSDGLALGLDERWVAKAGARAPYELRNVRVEDPDHFVTLASTQRIALDLPAIRVKAARDLVPDELMTMGPRPAESARTKGVGSRLLLVHGYCSSDVWPASQFTNASKFLDLNQNRTHDQFARLIQSFGNTWNSFGIVAHSQGGAAALHLYTYYWSGLDKATGSRLIQSVGTPYQGTNLAGILAALGSWFGVGCGTNDNLTYSGAASWLAGIPTSSRAKVNYYTTSFTDNWWSYDYCNAATDVVLSDPEDGTTEKAYGQLSGATNRGHATGQCHTAGMRDPAQYLNASRNSTMNTNAAR